MTVRTQEWVACPDIESALLEASKRLEVVEEQAKRLRSDKMQYHSAALLAELTGKSYILNDLMNRLTAIVNASSEYGTLTPKTRRQE